MCVVKGQELHDAVRSNNRTRVDAVLDAGANVNWMHMVSEGRKVINANICDNPALSYVILTITIINIFSTSFRELYSPMH